MMDYYARAWSKYAVFDGRAQRAEYWYFTLGNLLIYFALGVLHAIPGIRVAASVAVFVYVVTLILPAIAVSVRRLHDTDRSAWWVLLALIPFVGGIILLIFYIQDSTPGTNRYGENPKGVAASAPPPSAPPASASTPPPAQPA